MNRRTQPPESLEAEAALAALRDARAPDATARRIVDAATRPRAQSRVWIPWAIGASLAAVAAAAIVFVLPTDPTTSVDTMIVGDHRVERRADADLEVVRRSDADTLIRLTQGAADFTVAPLASGESFRVRTAEVEVEVVGTAFRVASQDGCSTVQVTEGRVRVSAGRESVLLGAGEDFRHCATAVESVAPGQEMVREAQRLMLDPASNGRAAQLFDDYARQHPDGIFLEEALFHMAFARRAAGDEAGARRAAERFLERFPDSRRATRIRHTMSVGTP